MKIKENTIYIVSNSIKKDILLNNNELINTKFMSLEELIDKLTFTYDNKAICYLTNKYNIKKEVALTYLNNIKYIDNDDYNNESIKKLIDIKKELDDNNLLIKDNYINLLLKDKDIIVYGYDYIPKYYRKYLDKINANIIDKEYKDYKHDIYEFNFIDEEIEYVSNKIIDLINNGVDINKIKLCNIDDDYIIPIKRIFDLYNIPVELNNNDNIYNTLIIKDFLSLIKDNTIEESLDLLKDKYDLNDEDNNYIYNKLINLLNSYYFIEDKQSIINNLIYDLKHISTNKKILRNKVETITLSNSIINEDNYIFLMNFNTSSIPKIYKDDDYISDEIKEKLGIETSKELNKIEKEKDINIIKSIKNLTITYKLKTPYEKYIKSTLLDGLDYEVKQGKVINKYSNKMNYFKLSNKLDDLIKFSYKDNELDYLYSTYKDIKYRRFNNSFKGINKDDLYKLLNNKLSLSYSSMNNYYKCPFRYYMENVLYLSKEEKTFAIDIGNIFHELLSKSFNDNFDLDEEFEKVVSNTSVPKEIFFLNKLKDELKFVIDTIKYQNSFSSLDKALFENKVYVNKSGSIKLTFTGTIDKLLYKEDNDKTYVVIIDYKTGNPDINLNNSVYGIDMQLPVYLYLTKNMNIKNVEVIGFYLQRILDNEINKEKGKSYSSIKKDKLKLLGYTNSEEELISLFDKNYFDSEVIKSMKKTSNGFSKYARLINSSDIDKLINLTEKHIDNAFDKVLDGDFSIKPKRIDNELVSCKYCKYRDVCFRKEEDIENLKEKDILEYLNGGAE